MLIDWIFTRVARAPESETGGGDTAAATADTTTTEATTETTEATTTDAATTDATEAATAETTDTSTATGPKWWEDAKRFDPDAQKFLRAKGLTVDDPTEAMAKLAQIARHSEQRLGKPADQLIDRPAKDQSIADYMKANAELFGIPEKPEGYEIAPPESWPKDAPWDTALEARAREVGHELGLNTEQLQGMANLMAESRLSEVETAEQELAQAQQAMEADLKKDWGDQYGAKLAQAQQAASVVAEAAGMDAAAMENLSQALASKAGDPAVIRMFAAIGDMMGDDFAAGLGGGQGGTIGTTPAEARQQLEAMMAPDSDFMKAQAQMAKTGQRAEYDRLQKEYMRLNKIAAKG